MSETLRLPAITRIEGHGRVSLVVGDDGRVTDARFNVLEFRGFEKLLEGRMIWEMPLVTSRICGICPVSHHLAAVKAADALLGAEIPPAAKVLRELLQLAGFVHDHALHFFLLAGPDFLLGRDAPSRDLLGVLEARPDLARRAIALRKAGQHVVEVLGGQPGHPVTAIPGGMSRPLADDARVELLATVRDAILGAAEAETLSREATLRLLAEHPGFASAPTPLLAQVAAGRAFDVYDGTIVALAADGSVADGFPASDYAAHIGESTLPWTYAKAPYLKAIGVEDGSYRVGPLARLRIAGSMRGDRADRAAAAFRSELGDTSAALAYHWARMIELVAVLERMEALLADAATSNAEVRVKVERRGGSGSAAVEAPRGTLIHHYEADDVGRVTRADIIVATTQNSVAIGRAAAEAVAGERVVDGELEDAVRLRMELGIRAYDPCLSCATHEVGRMPFSVEVIGPCVEGR
ncbi:MAG TPA: Ni/Fe hydrogenase subunit alpha [Coriobacteriia bacterium]|jgi:NAD-reducing hydrogenase large subunit